CRAVSGRGGRRATAPGPWRRRTRSRRGSPHPPALGLQRPLQRLELLEADLAPGEALAGDPERRVGAGVPRPLLLPEAPPEGLELLGRDLARGQTFAGDPEGLVAVAVRPRGPAPAGTTARVRRPAPAAPGGPAQIGRAHV